MEFFDLSLSIKDVVMVAGAIAYVIINRYRIKALEGEVGDLKEKHDNVFKCMTEVKTLLARIDERLKNFEKRGQS